MTFIYLLLFFFLLVFLGRPVPNFMIYREWPVKAWLMCSVFAFVTLIKELYMDFDKLCPLVERHFRDKWSVIRNRLNDDYIGHHRFLMLVEKVQVTIVCVFFIFFVPTEFRVPVFDRLKSSLPWPLFILFFLLVFLGRPVPNFMIYREWPVKAWLMCSVFAFVTLIIELYMDFDKLCPLVEKVVKQWNGIKIQI